METKCRCKICGQVIEGEVDDRREHLRSTHPELTEDDIHLSYKLYKILPDPFLSLKKKNKKEKFSLTGLKWKKSNASKQEKVKRKSIRWSSVIKSSFETSRRKH